MTHQSCSTSQLIHAGEFGQDAVLKPLAILALSPRLENIKPRFMLLRNCSSIYFSDCSFLSIDAYIPWSTAEAFSITGVLCKCVVCHDEERQQPRALHDGSLFYCGISLPQARTGTS